METLDGLDIAYRNLGRVCDGGPLAGYTPRLAGVGDTLTPEERAFAQWQETLGESARRFTAATSQYLKVHGGGGAVGQFYADRQMIQFCDYAVKNWDRIDRAAEVIKRREAALILQGKMKDLDSAAATLGVTYVTPVAPVAPRAVVHGVSGPYAGDFADSLARAVEMDRRGVPTGLGEVDDSYLDAMDDDDVLRTAGALGMVMLDDGGMVTIDLGSLGVPSEQRVLRVPRYELMDYDDGPYGYPEGVYGLDGRWRDRMRARRAARRERRKQTAQKIKKAFQKAGQAVKRTVKKVAAKVKQAARYVADKTKGAFQAVGQALKSAVTFVKDGVTYIWDKTKGLMKKVGNAIVRAAKAAAKALKSFGQKMAAAFKKWAKRLNPKNIITRCVILRKVNKGEYGLATGAYYGMLGEAGAARLGVRGKEYQDSRAAYDALRAKWAEAGGRADALDRGIRMGWQKFKGKLPSREEIRRGVEAEGKEMDARQLEAQEQEAVKREEGLSGGLGSLTAAIVSLIVAIISAIVALVQQVIKYLQAQKARREAARQMEEEKQAQAAETKRMEEAAAAQQREAKALEEKANALQAQAARGGSPAARRAARALPNGRFNVVDTRTGAVVAANVSRAQAAALTAPAAGPRGVAKPRAGMARAAVAGALAVGALLVATMLRGGGK